ncbi:MAG: hypothetical protein JWM21_3868 [Acidobacteria bacterium]|nr:hypothetical protein [Acidobacteriota bacterium]
MKIYFESVGGRLPGLHYEQARVDLQEAAYPWFWVVHPADSASNFLTDTDYVKEAERCLANGGGILFIKGTRYAGEESEADAEALERKHKRRIHCLRVPVSSESHKIISRIGNFLLDMEKLEAGEAIPWSKAEPEKWPENLVALYLLLVAIQSSASEAEHIRDAWRQLDPEWRRQLLTNAWVEYCDERNLNKAAWTIAGLPDTDDSRNDFDLANSSTVAKALEVLRASFSVNP